jgi:hypothetical protein
VPEEIPEGVRHHVRRTTGAVRNEDARDLRPFAIDRPGDTELATMAAQARRAMPLFALVSITAAGGRAVIEEARLVSFAARADENGSDDAEPEQTQSHH